jgi:hypothetical protein
VLTVQTVLMAFLDQMVYPVCPVYPVQTVQMARQD